MLRKLYESGRLAFLLVYIPIFIAAWRGISHDSILIDLVVVALFSALLVIILFPLYYLASLILIVLFDFIFPSAGKSQSAA